MTNVAGGQDYPNFNAGHGSNLTEEGVVECDASCMAGDGAFGAVGAMPGTSLSQESLRTSPPPPSGGGGENILGRLLEVGVWDMTL